MGTTKVNVGILFGGQSAEHEVSLKSTAALMANLDREAFAPTLIYINRDGFWRVMEEAAFLAGEFAAPGGQSFLPWQMEQLKRIDVDIYFPMLHGPNGEDGKIQGLLEMAGKPYVGANSVSSALAMDKVVSKILFKNAGLLVGDYLFFESNEAQKIHTAICDAFGYPVFVKPSAMGSSVGISRVDTPTQLTAALNTAFCYDRKVLVEKALNVREIEISVMGNDDIKVSRPGELIPHNDFYDYNDKYKDGKTTFHMPAQLDEETEAKVRRVAAQAYKALFLNGMSRVDLFLEKHTGTIYVNEINTIPGFTEISMFPKLWLLEDISFGQLVTQLIEYGFHYYRQHRASTAVTPETNR